MIDWLTLTRSRQIIGWNGFLSSGELGKGGSYHNADDGNQADPQEDGPVGI